MDAYLVALGFALLPAVGNFAGGLLAECVAVREATLAFALHLAAGVIFAVVGLELMTTALEASPAWVIGIAFVAGGAAAVGLDKLMGYATCRFGRGGSGPWMIYAGVCVDLFSDGVMIGTGTTIATSLALLLALGQVVADVPEGFATMATFRKRGVARSRRMLLSLSLAVPILLGTTIGYWAMRDLPEIYKLALLALTAGLLTAVGVEEMMTQAHQARREGEDESGWQTIALVSGFALFAMLSVYLESE